MDDEVALRGFGSLNVAVFAFGGVDNMKMDEAGRFVADFEAEFIRLGKFPDLVGLP